ncbi:hypothetical protein OKW37_000597 [Paraburkholderia sp. MM5482-R2]
MLTVPSCGKAVQRGLKRTSGLQMAIHHAWPKSRPVATTNQSGPRRTGHPAEPRQQPGDMAPSELTCWLSCDKFIVESVQNKANDDGEQDGIGLNPVRTITHLHVDGKHHPAPDTAHADVVASMGSCEPARHFAAKPQPVRRNHCGDGWGAGSPGFPEARRDKKRRTVFRQCAGLCLRATWTSPVLKFDVPSLR